MAGKRGIKMVAYLDIEPLPPQPAPNTFIVHLNIIKAHYRRFEFRSRPLRPRRSRRCRASEHPAPPISTLAPRPSLTYEDHHSLQRIFDPVRIDHNSFTHE